MNEEVTTDLIGRAIDAGASAETIIAVDGIEQRKQDNAERLIYFSALADFQSTCPEIKRTKKAGKFSYAPLDSIIKQLNGHPERFGFSFRFDEESTAEGKTVRCIVTHTAGHSETSTVFVPTYIGAGHTNVAQDAGGASTYGRRYSFANAFGLVIDDDDDGTSAGPNHILKVIGMVKALRSFREEVNDVLDFFDTGDVELEDAAKAYANLTREALTALNLAPSYGGLFTTDERAFLKSDKEFHDAVTEARNNMSPPWHERPENHL